MNRSKPLERRAALKTDPDSAREFQDRARRNSNPKRRPVSECTPAQRKLVKTFGRCANCGERARDGFPIDPAHIISKGVLSVGQDDVRAVIPLCRLECHSAYDDGRLDLLPILESEEWREHLAFAVERYGLVRTLERVTCCRWQPARRTA